MHEQAHAGKAHANTAMMASRAGAPHRTHLGSAAPQSLFSATPSAMQRQQTTVITTPAAIQGVTAAREPCLTDVL